jgi:hypothetical protein
VERRLPDFGLGVVDDLEVCAVALAQAHEHCRSSAATSSSDGAVVREMHRLHRRLRAELESLRGRGQLSLPNASRKRGRPSDAKRCAELESFCRLVRAHLALVLRKTDIAPVELTYAETLIESFRRRHPSAVDAREKQRVLRAKLFTLFVRDYDEIRRAVTYLRWRDAEMLAPPLHQVHGAPRAAAARPAATRSAARRSAASPTHPTRLRSFRK